MIFFFLTWAVILIALDRNIICDNIIMFFFLPLFLFNSFWFYILYSIILEKVISNNFFDYSIILKCTYCFWRLERRFNGQFCDVFLSIFFEMKISCTIVSVWLVKSFLCLLCSICDWPIMLQAWPIRNQLFKISRTKTAWIKLCHRW